MKIKTYFQLLLLLLFSPTLQALEIWDKDDWRWSVSGFGTLGGVYSMDKNIGYLRDITQPNGANGFSIDTDSRLGLQTNLKWRDIEMVVQAVSRYHVDNTYSPELTMALLKFNLTDDVTVRGGRLLSDFFMSSETRNIGYSYLMIRPPVEELGLVYLNYFDGGDIVYHLNVDDILLSFKASGGVISEPVFLLGNRSQLGKAFYQLQANAQWDDWKARISFVDFYYGQNTPAIGRLFPVLRNLPDLAAKTLSQELSISGRTQQYYNASLSWTPSPFSADVSLGLLDKTEKGIPAANYFIGFLNLGYKIEDWTPYFTFAWSAPFDKKPLTRLPPVYGNLATTINTNLQGIDDWLNMESRTYSLGMRYDFVPNMDAKFQVDFIDSNPKNLLWQTYSDRRFDGNNVVFGLTFDFMF